MKWFVFLFGITAALITLSGCGDDYYTDENCALNNQTVAVKAYFQSGPVHCVVQGVNLQCLRIQ